MMNAYQCPSELGSGAYSIGIEARNGKPRACEGIGFETRQVSTVFISELPSFVLGRREVIYRNKGEVLHVHSGL